MDSPQAFEMAVIKKIARRILPLVLVAYCIAYVDRANIAVAALTMNQDLGFSAFTYGLGAGILRRLLYLRGSKQFDPYIPRTGSPEWSLRSLNRCSADPSLSTSRKPAR